MRRFAELPSQALLFTLSDNAVWVTAWVAIALITLLLIFIALHFNHPVAQAEITGIDPILRHVRRHSARGGVYPQDATVLLPRLPTSHWAIDVEWRDSQHPIDAPSTGKRSVHNPARMIVPSDWMPPIGSERIRMLETTTVEVTEFRRLLREDAV